MRRVLRYALAGCICLGVFAGVTAWSWQHAGWWVLLIVPLAALAAMAAFSWLMWPPQ